MFPPRVSRAALSDASAAYAAFKPPRRVTVSKGAQEALFLRQPGGYVGPWSPDETPYMVEPMDMMASKRYEAVCFVGPARTGKALDLNTPIPTPDGWTTMGDLKVGDEILAPSGNPTTIVFATEVQHGRTCYEVEFSDGSTIVADAEHRWGVERFYWKSPNWRYEVRTTEELIGDLKYGGNRFRYHVRNTAPIDLPAKNLDVDPYLLGVWIGDGAAAQAYISSSKGDAQHYVEKFALAGHKVDTVEDGPNTVMVRVDMRHRLTTHCQRGHSFAELGRANNGGCMECGRQGHHRRKYGVDNGPLTAFADTFYSRLHRIGVAGNKHIPKIYLRASIEQRMDLLRGLMDTDGTFDKRTGRVEFTTVSPSLRDGFLELTRSLGFRPAWSEKKTSWEYKGEKKSGKAYRISFPIPLGARVFSLPRKADHAKQATVDVGYRAITAIRPVETRPVRCIQVSDESHLFLAGEGMVPTHNTMGLLDGFISYAVTCDPGDTLIVQMTQEKAREYSKTRIDRAIRHSPAINALMSKTGHDDNTHDKLFRHGMWLKIGWPTVTQLSGSDYRYVLLTDYDRMPDDIDGEGSAYGLALKRTQTFISRGMCLVESSPGRVITDPNWQPTTLHEGPPCTGVVGIYNRSDRRRWYWPCPHCDEFFEAKPGLDLFGYPEEDKLLEIVREADLDEIAHQYGKLICPHCGCLIDRYHKHAMNRKGKWVSDGQVIYANGTIEGDPMKSTIAGYWLGGVAAAYQSWHSLGIRYLQGLREYVLTGSELSLQNTVNTDQGLPYLSMLVRNAAKKSAGLEGRKDPDQERFIVPDEARFVVSTVDVQGGQNASFVVQVSAVGQNLEQWPIDRFSIINSKREGVDGKPAPLDPAAYPEDWDLVTELVIKATYRTSDENREVKVKAIAIDTGGEDGVTDKAYEWYRRLRREGLHNNVMLVKGASTPAAPLIRESWVGAKRGNNATDKGDIPLYLLNTNLFKDAVTASLKRTVPGPAYIHMPGWLPKAFYEELKAEIRDGKGRWVKVKKRNEAFDLLCYTRALCVRLGADRPEFWDAPPAWAKPLDENSLVITREERRRMQEDGGQQQPAAVRRRSTRSAYLK